MHRLFGKKKEAGPVVPPPTLEATIAGSEARTGALDTKVMMGGGGVWPVGGAEMGCAGVALSPPPFAH
jgi:hypothetical protein